MSFANPEQIVTSFEVLPGTQVADFGAGSGHWAIALSKHVGPSGKVYAIDIQKEALASVRSRAKMLNIINIETIWADLEVPHSSSLRDNSVDLVLISNILSQADNKPSVLQEAHRILKEGGKLAIIEWDEPESLTTLAAIKRIPRQEVEHMLKNMEFKFEKEFAAGSYHYGLLFRKHL